MPDHERNPKKKKHSEGDVQKDKLRCKDPVKGDLAKRQKNHPHSDESTSQVRVTQKVKAGCTQTSTMGLLSPRAYLDLSLLFHSFMDNIISSIDFGEHFTYQESKFLWC
jgi:hypothetical protein